MEQAGPGGSLCKRYSYLDRRQSDFYPGLRRDYGFNRSGLARDDVTRREEVRPTFDSDRVKIIFAVILGIFPF